MNSRTARLMPPGEEYTMGAPEGKMMTETAAGQVVSGHIKWFDRKRGFGFIVPADGSQDILIHCSVIEAHGRRELPEGTALTCHCVAGPRGRHAVSIDGIDLSSAVEQRPANVQRSARRVRPADPTRPYLAATVKWFSRVKGYGFIEVEGFDVDVFLHMETLRDADFGPVLPGDPLLVQVGDGPKGPMAVDIQPETGSD